MHDPERNQRPLLARLRTDSSTHYSIPASNLQTGLSNGNVNFGVLVVLFAYD